MQRAELLARLPQINGALSDVVDEGVLLAAARQGLDLAQLDADVFCLDALRSQPHLDGLPEKHAHALSNSTPMPTTAEALTPLTAAWGRSGAPGGMPG